ncbi:hypothetical protein [Mucilaginibacter jinjuensis]|uniref:Uncharacterized protein n=1 Tax=Mucilaginibacter jinjuensis TaxID=1176721 RepID=A0ABY7T5B4_9SPHI|nr:hypothetical protein [Mucilaginibacter jinjuensis]WCT11463.1 hypothetical protein PQO05_22240 [Mucilaginibacter jinjuensis]
MLLLLVNISIFVQLKIQGIMNSMQNANDERHYMVLTASIVIGFAGIFLRFAGEAPYWSWISNVVLVLGIIVALKGVFAILK